MTYDSSLPTYQTTTSWHYQCLSVSQSHCSLCVHTSRAVLCRATLLVYLSDLSQCVSQSCTDCCLCL